MKITMTFIALFLSVNSQAGTLSKNFSEKMLNELSVHNGMAQIGTYNPKEFNLGKKVSDIKDENALGNCSFKVSVSRKLAIESMKRMGDTEAAGVIEGLYKKGLLKTALVNQTDSETDAIEQCNSTELEIYSNDGEVLRIIYDYST